MFKTLDDYKDPQKKEKKPGDKETSSYTGGGKSGLAVENPNQIDDIVAKAQKYLFIKIYNIYNCLDLTVI